MPYSLDKANELPLICGERAMARRHRSAEECDGVAVLDQHCVEAISRRVALDNERLGEVRQCQHWCRRHRPFEGTESSCCVVVVPHEPLLLQESRDGAVVVDELPVVPRQVEEAAHRPRRSRLRPVVDGLYLGRIHGHSRRGYGVPQVGDGVHAEGALDEEAMLTEHREDDAEVAQVVRPG